LRKILVANRGEIAVRVIRACRDMGLSSVAVYSDCDRTARHVRMADEACAIGADAPADSYLNIPRLVDAARATGADAVHPGYGFLSENEDFAVACREAGLTFIGPTPEAIALMGSKTAARRAARAAGVPVVPGTDEPFAADATNETISATAAQVGYPLLVKAVAGGGGRGMRRVETAQQLEGAIRTARSEAGTAFGDSAVYLERRLERPRHVEVQLLGDQHGVVVPFVERECSIQRRHQKVVEETPSPAVTPALRERLAAAAAALARSVRYTGAGTIEFLVDESGAFWFLEMNTRLQVEHPITETVTGIDLVEWQIRIARGERITLDPAAALTPRGHAIECRIYAEDPDAGFLPSPGRILRLQAPDGPWIRDDRWAESDSEVPVFYDSLLSKLVAWGGDRPQALARMRRALREYRVLGVQTTVPFSRWLLEEPAFQAGAFHTGFLDEVLQQRAGESFSQVSAADEDAAVVAVALHVARRRIDPPPFGAVASRWNGQEPQPAMTPGLSGWKQRARLETLRA
jgi:acetyl-CoA carboxylase biotin carboxylase subunit